MSSILDGFHRAEQYSKRLLINERYRHIIVSSERSWNTDSTQEISLRAESARVLICGDQLRFGVILIPKSFMMSLCWIFTPFGVVYSKYWFENGSCWDRLHLLVVWHMSSNLSSWRIIWFRFDQLMVSFRSCWRRETSSEVDMALRMRVSSAKWLIKEWCMHWWRSFM